MLLHLAESKFAWIHSGVQLPAWAPARGASTAAAAAAGAAGAAGAEPAEGVEAAAEGVEAAEELIREEL